MRLQILRIFVVAMFGGFLASSAEAQTAATPQTVKSATGQLGASINNAGLQQSFDVSASRKLTRSKNPWLAESHAAVGGSVAATPAGVRGGAWAEFAPLSVLAIRAGAEPAQYFGTFHSLTSFDSRLDAFDTDARKARAGAVAARALKLYAAGTLQARVGRLIGRSTLTTEWWSSTAAGPLFYEPTRDTLLEVDGDRLQTLSSALLYQHKFSGGGDFTFGPTHSLMQVGGNELNQVQKIGVVAIRQMSRRHLGLSQPTLTAQVAHYLDDPNKQGQWSAAVAIGFALKK